MTLAVALTVGCAVAVAALLAAEHGKHDRARLIAKSIAAACFVALGALRADGSGYAQLVVAGLALGAAGDVALVFPGKRAFLAGLGLFLLGHLAYVAAFAELAPARDWLQPIAAVPLACGAGALVWLWPRLDGKMRGPVVCYVAVISAMVVGALAVGTSIIIAAAGLFFASDLAVARHRFVRASFVNKAWGLPAYFAGQLLFAYSI